MRVVRRALLLLSLSPLALAACQVSALEGGSSETAGTLTAEAAPALDGRVFGYIRSVKLHPDPPTIDFDDAELLTGKAALKAAAAAGALEGDGTLPNDYYIVNEDKATVTLVVADHVKVTRVSCLTSCKESFEDAYRAGQSQYTITVKDGLVTAIDEKYLP
jgi:hypothetical protein